MTLDFNAAFVAQPQQRSPAKSFLPQGDEAFLAAMGQVIDQEHRSRAAVGAAEGNPGAALQKNRFHIENGKNLKFPMDEDILDELLTQVKSKIKQLKQSKEQWELS